LDEAGRLRRLQSTIQLANRAVRRNLRRARARNKRHCDKDAKEQAFQPGQVVYLHNLAKKPGVSSKFVPDWKGPYSVTRKVGELNYQIIDEKGNESTVHINRLMLARDPSIWKPPKNQPRPCRKDRGRLGSRRPEEQAVIRSRPIKVQAPLLGDRPVNPVNPHNVVDTPEVNIGETPEALRADQNYVVPETPRSRYEAVPTRQEPPVTSSRVRILEQSVPNSNVGLGC
jgi:hypothetical protein